MITFVTGNERKAREAERILPGLQRMELDLDEIQSLSAEEVVRHKLAQAAEHLGAPCVVEDVSLIVDGWNGLPGPFIKWYIKAIGAAGIAQRMPGRAMAQCTVGYFDGTESHYFLGECVGSIAAPRGEGFGFDPIFVPEGSGRTFHEMGDGEKDAISHRGNAFRKLAEHLRAVSGSGAERS